MKITPKKYAQLIYEMTNGLEKKEVIEVLKKIVDLVNQNGDSFKFNHIIEEFSSLYNKQEGIIEAYAQAANKLSETQIAQIKKKIAEKHGIEEGKVRVFSSEDPTVKGGVIIKVGNEIWDGSIENKLKRLKQSLAV